MFPVALVATNYLYVAPHCIKQRECCKQKKVRYLTQGTVSCQTFRRVTLWEAPAGILTISGYIRRAVVRTAMYWATAAILIIRILWGTSMAVAMHTVTAHATNSRVISAALYLWGLLGVTCIGFQSRSADIFDKAGQTATVGLLCYLAVLIAFLVIRGWPK